MLPTRRAPGTSNRSRAEPGRSRVREVRLDLPDEGRRPLGDGDASTELRPPPAGRTDRIGCDLIAVTALDCILEQRTNHLTDRLAARLGDLFEFTSGRATDSDSERRHYNHQSRTRDSARITRPDCMQPLAELTPSFDERFRAATSFTSVRRNRRPQASPMAPQAKPFTCPAKDTRRTHSTTTDQQTISTRSASPVTTR